MSSEGSAPFTVDMLPAAAKKISELGKKAKTKGELSVLVRALKDILERLSQGPLDWGDPEYHPKQKGSTVCHGVMGSLWVQIVVFEPERLVTILQVRCLPGSSLE